MKTTIREVLNWLSPGSAEHRKDKAEEELKTLLLDIVKKSRDKSLPLAYIEKTIEEL